MSALLKLPMVRNLTDDELINYALADNNSELITELCERLQRRDEDADDIQGLTEQLEEAEEARDEAQAELEKLKPLLPAAGAVVTAFDALKIRIITVLDTTNTYDNISGHYAIKDMLCESADYKALEEKIEELGEQL